MVAAVNAFSTIPFQPRRGASNLAAMNRFLVQFSGVFVTALVVFGTDSDVLTAAPLGLFAGTFAAFLIFITDLGFAKARQ